MCAVPSEREPERERRERAMSRVGVRARAQRNRALLYVDDLCDFMFFSTSHYSTTVRRRSARDPLRPQTLLAHTIIGESACVETRESTASARGGGSASSHRLSRALPFVSSTSRGVVARPTPLSLTLSFSSLCFWRFLSIVAAAVRARALTWCTTGWCNT